MPTTLPRRVTFHQLHSTIEFLLWALPYPGSGIGCSIRLPLGMIALRFEAVGKVAQVWLELQPILSLLLVVQSTLWLFTSKTAELFDSFLNTACRQCSQRKVPGTVYWGCQLHYMLQNVQRAPSLVSIENPIEVTCWRTRIFRECFRLSGLRLRQICD